MRTALYVLLALAAPAFAGQTVYKWVDEKGVTHFSDQPMAGAEKVELSSGANRPATPAPSYTPPSSSTTRSKAGPAYSRFVIESPQQDQSIVNTGGKVAVQVGSTPAIDSVHTLQLYLDGARVSDFSQSAMGHEFSNMPRGTHTVKAVVVGQDGKPVQETPVVTFHVRQESAVTPPVGPALRNQNKPQPRAAGNKMRTSQPTYQALNGGIPQMDPRTNKPVNMKPAPTVPKK